MILVFRVPFRDLGDFWDPEMQVPPAMVALIFFLRRDPGPDLVEGKGGGGGFLQQGFPPQTPPFQLLRRKYEPHTRPPAEYGAETLCT